MRDTNLTQVYDLGFASPITTQQAVDAAINMAEAALRQWGVEDIAELSPKKREDLFAAVNRTLQALGVKEISEDWWEYHDWQELEPQRPVARIVVA